MLASASGGKAGDAIGGVSDVPRTSQMCRERSVSDLPRPNTSRVSFLMCPFCVRSLLPDQATHRPTSARRSPLRTSRPFSERPPPGGRQRAPRAFDRGRMREARRLSGRGAYANHSSLDSSITALRSRIGVPSIASKARTRSRVGASMAVTVTRCRPMGFGRSDDHVAKTPVSGVVGSPRGCVCKTLRSAR